MTRGLDPFSHAVCFFFVHVVRRSDLELWHRMATQETLKREVADAGGIG